MVFLLNSNINFQSFIAGIAFIVLMAALGITTVLMRGSIAHNAQTGFRDLFNSRFATTATLSEFNAIQQDVKNI